MKIDFLRKIFLKIFYFWNFTLRKWFYLKSRIQCFFSWGTLIYGELVTLNVPLRCDGKGKVILGNNVSIGYSKAPKIGNGAVLIQARLMDSLISIGERTVTSNNVSIVAIESITIGSNCLIGDSVTIFDSDFHETEPTLRHVSRGKSLPIFIGNNVWLGSRVMVMKGVRIGDNSVIGAGSVVVKSIPKNMLAAGVPAKVIKAV